MKDCRFCQIAKSEVEDYVIWEDEKFIAFLDINPINSGHCMLIPKKHFDHFFDLDNELYLELFKTAKILSEPLKTAMNAKRVGIAVVGFDIPHAHLHLVPLHGPNEMFSQTLFKPAKPEDLKEVQQKIKQHISNYDQKK